MMTPYSEMKKHKCGTCRQVLLLLTGVLLTTFGISIFVFFESFYEYVLNDGLKFTNTSPAYKAWKTNDPPLIMDIYMFNWTNPGELQNTSVKPEFEELGPYRFKEVKEKINITWNQNGTLSYKTKRYYYFDKENSKRQLNDLLTIINIVPLSINYKMRFSSFFAKRSVSLALSALSKLYVTKTVGEILFDGYDEPILKSLSYLPLVSVMDRFGLFYGRNNTIERGISSMHFLNDENFGKIVSFDHRNRTDYFDGHCGDIKGSASEFYPLNVKKDRLIFYSSELCKYADLEYEGEVVVKGVKGYRFTADNLFDNGTKRQENSCFCHGECIPSGVFNVSTCREGSPSFLSLPHFFGADPSYRNAIKGMKPNRSLHEFYITIEPKSGIVMDIMANMQLNMLLQPVKNIHMFEKTPRVFMPIFYFSQRVDLTDDLAANLRLIQNLPEYTNYTGLIVILLGTGSIIWALCSCFCCSRTKDKYRLNQKGEVNGTVHCPEEVPLKDKH